MAKPKLALIPAAQGSKFYSVLPSDGVGDFDFTRASAATRVNKDGLIETVASGQSRLNYPLIDGVVKGCPHHLLEPARTNLLTYSEDFSQWINISTVTNNANSVISPDGTQNASNIEFGATGTSKLFYQTASVALGQITSSIYLKGTGTLRIYMEQGGGGYFNEIIVTLTSYWVRYDFSVNATLASTVLLVINRMSTNTATEVDIFGAQLEQGSYQTSYIKTNGEIGGVTRVAETATGAGDASTFNDSEGVLMAEISALADDAVNKQMSLNNTLGSNTLRLIYNANNIRAFVQVSSTTVVDITHALSNAKDVIKVLLKYKVNDYALWVNGFEVATNTNATTFPINTLNQFSFDDSSSSKFYGNVKQIQYFDSALTDSELETLTSWTSFTDMAEGQLYSIQ